MKQRVAQIRGDVKKRVAEQVAQAYGLANAGDHAATAERVKTLLFNNAFTFQSPEEVRRQECTIY
jgi:hypothetical protein